MAVEPDKEFWPSEMRRIYGQNLKEVLKERFEQYKKILPPELLAKAIEDMKKQIVELDRNLKDRGI